jgi:hypothetical protein
MTPTASLGYEATSKFLDHITSSIKERIKMVICLDALSDLFGSSSKTLFVYNSHLSEQDSLSNHFIKELKKAGPKKHVKIEVKDGK